MTKPIVPIERFARKISIARDGSGCWLWTGNRIDGYGVIKIKGGDGAERNVMAHRFAYTEFVGPIPEGKQLDHLCRTRHCARPDHLEPVTSRENTLRGNGPCAINAMKRFCPQGHELFGANAQIDSRGFRKCRTCQKRHYDAFMARKREAAHA